jgi:processive 1,2-diacylglycerol beta-glucosyltransferase
VTSPFRAVVIYSRVGAGHLSAARALAKELESSGRCTAHTVDIYVDCGRFPVTKFPAAYAALARDHPLLWSAIYGGSSASHLSPSAVLRPFLRSGLRRMLACERPDVVVSVLPAVNGLLSEATARSGARLEVVLTDWHSVHQFWVARGVQHYSAPTESARLDCIRYGASATAVDVTGIPVRPEFVDAVDRTEVRQSRLTELGLEPRRFTILVMVGGEGSPHALRNVAELANSRINAQLVVVCGRSDELRRQVEHLRARMPVRALGFVDDVAGLLRSADVLVTKAGGLTLAEAFCCGVPVVIHDVLPGQEAGNLEYVLAKGAVEYAPSPPRLIDVVCELLANPSRRASLAERGSQLARPHAADDIVKNVLARLERLRS